MSNYKITPETLRFYNSGLNRLSSDEAKINNEELDAVVEILTFMSHFAAMENMRLLSCWSVNYLQKFIDIKRARSKK